MSIEIVVSESTAMQSSSEDYKSNSIQDEAATVAPSCVPKIVMNYVSGSHSTDNSLNSKDNLSNTKKNKRRDKKNRRKDQDMRASVLAEGQRSEVARNEAAAISSEPRLQESGWTKSSLAKANTVINKHTAMERADMGPSYTSDEWEADSVNSDTDDDDHTDSSDDDDPKSQVDRLIERGTLMYMEGENSGLSSEDETDTDDDYDSESDITDVSPLVSATASPLGLSPVLPRRTIPTSPLALHDNRELSVEYDDPNQCPFDWDSPSPSPPLENDLEDANESPNEENNRTSMNLLLQAVIELENQNNIENFNLNNHNSLQNPSKDQVFIHPIRDNPHHIHLNKTFHRRKNMSFSNEEVRQIDRENKILLKKIMAAHTRKPTTLAQHNSKLGRYPRPTNSASNRKREESIRKENLLLLKKIQEVKPSKEVVAPIGDLDSRLSSVVVSKGSLRPPTSTCGAFLRSVQTPHVTVPAPRKETAL